MLKITFFTFGTLIVAIFMFVMAVLLLRIQKRAISTNFLAATYLLIGCHALAFVMASVLVHPLGAYHRWMVLLVVPSLICMTQFFFYYPNPRSTVLARRLFVIQMFMWILFCGFYIFRTAGVSPVFDPAEQSWVFRVPDANKALGILLLVYVLALMVAGIWRASRREPGAIHAWMFLGLFLLLVLPPVVANGLSRAGIISRSTFLSIYIFFMVPGAFSLLVLYINTTSDRTRFIGRIVAVCLGSFLLLFYWAALIQLPLLERSYDQLNIQKAFQAIHAGTEPEGFSLERRPSVETHSIPEATAEIPVQKDSADFKEALGLSQQELRRSGLEAENFRFLRMDSAGSPAYFSYVIGDPSSGVEHEANFPYSSYRDFMNDAIGRYVVVLLLAIAVILVGFRFFFKGALWNPLQSLLSGIRKVNEGDLSIRIPFRVYDEIGFLTETFNQMVSSIQEARSQLANHAETLEIEVDRRTQELQKMLEQQQGDYYLTSLLLKPFGRANFRNDSVGIEFFTRQKKEFTFKNQSYEIGGDLSMADRISIDGRPFTAFVNADAMGKSIQGAGGAIVLGSVFGAILQRGQTQETAQIYNTPERWLRAAYKELSRVFEMFNGNMLITAILGLVDETSGTVYLVNADHPFPAVLRKNRASFLRMRDVQGRLGMPPDQGHKFIVHTFKLQAGDAMFLGSDGKDDLELEPANEGIRSINEDDKVFLRQIEKHRGDLQSIYHGLREVGSITDDLSLVKIEFYPVHINGRSPSKPEVSVQTI